MCDWTSPSASLARLEHRLAALAATFPDRAPAVALQGRLIRAMLTLPRQPVVQPFPLPRERLLGKVHDGVPLLHDEPASIDLGLATDLFARLTDIVARTADSATRDRASSLMAAIAAGRLQQTGIVTEGFVQHHDHLADMAGAAGVDAALVLRLAALSVAPLLRAYAARLAPLLLHRQPGSADPPGWCHGYCPVCGAWPLLGQTGGADGPLRLRCAGCGHGWRTGRLSCPYCAADGRHPLRALPVDGDQRFTLHVCQRCRRYLKVDNASDPSPAELLTLDDLASAHLDAAAGQRGYARAAGTGVRIELAVPESAWAEELE